MCSVLKVLKALGLDLWSALPMDWKGEWLPPLNTYMTVPWPSLARSLPPLELKRVMTRVLSKVSVANFLYALLGRPKRVALNETHRLFTSRWFLPIFLVCTLSFLCEVLYILELPSVSDTMEKPPIRQHLFLVSFQVFYPRKDPGAF